MEVDQPCTREQPPLLLPLPPTLEHGSPSPPPSPTRGSTSPDGLNQARLLTFLSNARAQPKEAPLATNKSAPALVPQDTSAPPQEIIPPAANPPSVRDLLTVNPDLDDNPSSLSNRRDPLEKYTNAPMPWAQIHRPTSLYDNMDVEAVIRWWDLPGSKLLAIPFDGEVNNTDFHEDIKGCILAAVAEITLSTTASVTAPPPSEAASNKGLTPTSFIIYNISDTHYHILLQRRIWASVNFTFCVAPLEPACPDFLFALKGFTTLENSTVKETIAKFWNDEITTEFVQDLIRETPEPS